MACPALTAKMKSQGLHPAAGGGETPARGGGRGLPGADAGRFGPNGIVPCEREVR